MWMLWSERHCGVQAAAYEPTRVPHLRALLHGLQKAPEVSPFNPRSERTLISISSHPKPLACSSACPQGPRAGRVSVTPLGPQMPTVRRATWFKRDLDFP